MIREAPSEPSKEELIALIAAQRAELAALKAQIAELERRLGLNYQNPVSLSGATVIRTRPPRREHLRHLLPVGKISPNSRLMERVLAFKENFPARVAEVVSKLAPATPIE